MTPAESVELGKLFQEILGSEKGRAKLAELAKGNPAASARLAATVKALQEKKN